ncbi:serine hydrolase domain-containing protein [Herbidospora sp. NBRC 101105]|uniref:serine hydrolase domain-containing protein n=1 Tax=Herbidospora sp. NBRC 101105 TaxID=3032195 RepID=UPI0024A50EA3|nr:serine hydrolase domain-containing protein [Herbidospora sp. NBRC 101105]GLX99469.1 penicillin-binding protein [Herbidospora sp. NBRC 101105]
MTQVRPADPISAALRRLREPGFAHVGHLVVVRDGDTVAARAFGVRGLDEPADVFSVTKSVLATVTLLAVRDGRVSLDATLGELLGKRVPLARRDATVRHLLSMTGGAHCGGLEDIDRVMEQPGSWVDALLAVPGRYPPGEVFCYDNGAAHLLAAALQAATGDIAELAAATVFDPLGVAAWRWPRDPEGVPWGFGGLCLSPLDLARLGEAWRTNALGLGPLLAQATTAQSAGGPPENVPYGWLFWVCRTAGRFAYMAAGWAGQYVLVVPEEALTIVVTGEPEGLRPGSGSGLTVARDLAAALVAEQAR